MLEAAGTTEDGTDTGTTGGGITAIGTTGVVITGVTGGITPPPRAITTPTAHRITGSGTGTLVGTTAIAIGTIVDRMVDTMAAMTVVAMAAAGTVTEVLTV
jgi:hypothetical protein